MPFSYYQYVVSITEFWSEILGDMQYKSHLAQSLRPETLQKLFWAPPSLKWISKIWPPTIVKIPLSQKNPVWGRCMDIRGIFHWEALNPGDIPHPLRQILNFSQLILQPWWKVHLNITKSHIGFYTDSKILMINLYSTIMLNSTRIKQESDSICCTRNSLIIFWLHIERNCLV